MVARGTIVALVGPTGVGKSALAEAISVQLDGEIVSADSMQVYRGMDIGTAKQPPSERRVPYHCIDLLDPGEPYSAALFQADARTAIENIMRAGRLPVLVGGTGLYVRAALDDLKFPPGDLTGGLRTAIERRAADIGPAALHAELTAVDPAAAALIHPNNVRRTVRALEMSHEGRSYADQAGGLAQRSFRYPGTRIIGIVMERAALYSAIDSRVDAMIEDGLLAEVEALLAAGCRNALTASQAIGYKELVPVADGYADLASAIEAIQQATRRYAKRQLTWFRSDPRVEWLDVTGMSTADATSSLLDLLSSAEPKG